MIRPTCARQGRYAPFGRWPVQRASARSPRASTTRLRSSMAKCSHGARAAEVPCPRACAAYPMVPLPSRRDTNTGSPSHRAKRGYSYYSKVLYTVDSIL